MYLVILLVYVLLIAGIAVRGKLRMKRLLTASVTEETRVKHEISNIFFGGAMLFIVFVVCLFFGIGFDDIGFRPISFNYNIWFTIIILILCGSVVALFIYQSISPGHKKTASELDVPNSQKESYDKIMEALLPRSKKEKIWAAIDSITTGFYEEILTRGFLFYIFQMQFPDLSIIIIVLITSLMFGVGHLYQGLQGVVMTTIAGVLLGFLFVVMDSLILCILIHIFINFCDVFTVKSENAAKEQC